MFYNREYSPMYRGNHWSQSQPPRPPVNEDLLKSAEVHVERKTFVFSLKENMRGQLLRITENAGSHRNTIIIPATGLKDFLKVLEEMVKATEETSARQSDNTPPVDPQQA